MCHDLTPSSSFVVAAPTLQLQMWRQLVKQKALKVVCSSLNLELLFLELFASRLDLIMQEFFTV